MAGARVLLASFMHETNTFSATPTTREDFEHRRTYVGSEVIERLRGTETMIGGAIETARRRDAELVPIVAASATPGGPVTRDAYECYTDAIVAGVEERVDDLDGVLLPLHGAMVPEHLDDGEGPLIARVRGVVGPDVPISVALDLHGNVTDAMVNHADAIVAYKQYPHLDKAVTGRRGMSILIDTVRGRVDPTIHMERPPMIMYVPKQYTPSGPMAAVMERARDHERRDGVLAASVLPGYYHADVPEMGVTTPVVTDRDPALAREVSRDLAETAWTMRDDFVDDYPGPGDAVARARDLAAGLDDDDGPVVMGDFGSNPGGGGSADGTTIPRAMIEQGVENAGYAVLYDPETLRVCLEAGVGERVVVTLGGKTDDRHGAPIEDVEGYVKAITDGRYVNTGTSHTGRGVENDMGPTVLFQCGENDGLNVIISGRRQSAFDAEVWRHVGIQPERLDVLCIPSFIAFLGDYEPLSGAVVLADTPGASAVDPARFDYEHIPRPLFPLDELDDTAYPDSGG